MTSRRRLFAALAVGAALGAVFSPPVSAAAGWSVVPSPNSPGSNELLGAAASDPTHVWAAGRVVADTNPSTWSSLLLRWDGRAWTSVDHPHFPTNHVLIGVDAPAADDAWAVGTRLLDSGGSRTLIEHWDGVRWRVDRSPNPNRNGLNRLAAVKSVPSDPGTLWAVGSYSNPSGGYGDLTLIARRSGGDWRTLPSPNVTLDNHLEAVDATGPDDAWAVGWGNTNPFGGIALAIVLHWDGDEWREVPVPDPSQVMLFGVEAVSPDDVWAVGHSYQGGAHWTPLVMHWDGTEWTRATTPVAALGGQLRDVVAPSPTEVLAVGFSGEGSFAETLVLRWDGTSWQTRPTPSPRVGPKLFGAAVASDKVWAVGHRYEPDLLANQTLTLRSQ